ncbi:MBOAT family O-acyltransferase [Marinilactibacillus sp. GCM10026970]|uniref:MBOAT family O-acyltransferase n=1 Tax=Marinilactibacillus sp. GCM10026970 TaxID=3252642 RepID=UPI003619EB07
MLFNSLEFIFIFLPIVVVLFFFFNRINLKLGKAFLLIASLFFYGYWQYTYVLLILASIFVNFFTGKFLIKNSNLNSSDTIRKLLLIFGISFNLGILIYFKYFDFLIENLNSLSNFSIDLLDLALPLAISFFTFQQIAYIVDTYKGNSEDYDFISYSLFVTFFPQLIAGPIVHHRELLPQLNLEKNKILNYENVALGLYIFSIGLFKKVIIADSFAVWANQGFSSSEPLPFLHAWIASLSYTFQLYYDFSGYSDMAIGIGLLFNIRLPLNFNSPYKSIHIQEFWQKWHITLSKFLTDYIYIPLGGNRKGLYRIYINIFLVFLISGIWHGSGWTFIIWGVCHGIASIIYRLWKKYSNYKLPKWFAWFITFQFVNFTWIIFRSNSINQAINLILGMLGLNGIELGLLDVYDTNVGLLSIVTLLESLLDISLAGSIQILILVFFVLIATLTFKNTYQKSIEFTNNKKEGVTTFIILSVSVLFLIRVTEFLYFNF